MTGGVSLVDVSEVAAWYSGLELTSGILVNGGEG